MNETIGTKGGKNDNRRRLRIQKSKLEKIKRAEEKQEKKQTNPNLNIVQIPTVVKEIEREISEQTVAVIEQNSISIKETEIDEKLDNLKNNQIINYYENKLKEIKLDLKNTIYEYTIIVSETDKIYDAKIAQNLLNKISLIIKKLEELKNMIDIPNMYDFDQNYIYNLITKYINEFENNCLVDDIKDSELYILISSKIKELEEKTDKLSQKLDNKKDELLLDEKKLDKLKEKYNTFDNFNNMLIRFQAEQNSIAKDLEEKLKNATSIEEKTKIKIRILTEQTHIVRDLIVPQLLIPGVKSSIRTAVAAASLTHIMRNYIRPRTEISHYKVVNVVNYEKDITNSIDDIKKGLRLLKNSKNQLRKLLVEFKEDFKEYFGKVKECDKLLNNLEEILDALREKEDELNIMKENQENMLENNNNKVQVLK